MDHEKVIRQFQRRELLSNTLMVIFGWGGNLALVAGHFMAILYAVRESGLIAGFVTFLFVGFSDVYWLIVMTRNNGWDNILVLLFGAGLLSLGIGVATSNLHERWKERNQERLQAAYDAEYD